MFKQYFVIKLSKKKLVMENKTIEQLVDEIDFILIGFEDSMHGEDGKNVTHARKLLSKIRAAQSTKGEVRSVEEILKEHGIYPGFRSTYTYDGIVEAMKIFASQFKHSAPIRDEEKNDAVKEDNKASVRQSSTVPCDAPFDNSNSNHQ